MPGYLVCPLLVDLEEVGRMLILLFSLAARLGISTINEAPASRPNFSIDAHLGFKVAQ